jgi:hypothetical protein
VGEDPLYPFIEEQPWTVHELVEHPPTKFLPSVANISGF